MAYAALDIIVNSAPDKVWATCGAFDSPAQWHPVVAEVALSEDGLTRTMTLVNGQVIVERETNRSEEGMSYTYVLVESGMPVSTFIGQFQVMGLGTVSKIVWSADFDPAPGVSDEDATAMIERMLHSAGDSLSEMFG
jgi:hypothetical protein